MPQDELSFELGPIRPPSEANSLLLRLTRNCPWNRCAFCRTYKGSKFSKRSVAEVKQDIDAMQQLSKEIVALSHELGQGGKINRIVLTTAHHNGSQSLFQIAWWLYNGGKTVFLQDGDSLILKTPEIVEILNYLKQAFPQVERITTYTRSATLSRKSAEDLKELKKAGLTRIHVGMESGSDAALELINKGTTAAKHLKAGKAVKAAGISLSLYLLLGIGGRELSEEHARESGRVVSEINPDFLRMRTLVVPKHAPLADMVEKGEFLPPTEDQMIQEEKILVENLDDNFTGYLISDHSLNLLMEIEGQFPEARAKILETIRRYQELSPEEKRIFQLGRRTNQYRCLDDLQDRDRYQNLAGLAEQILASGKDFEESVAALRRKAV